MSKQAARQTTTMETGYSRTMLPRSRSFSQKCSISSVSGSRLYGTVAVHGRS